MENINVLLICGGGGNEHDISIKSAQFFKTILDSISTVNTFYVEIKKNGNRVNENNLPISLIKEGILIDNNNKHHYLNYAIPCVHGYLGETGHLQGIFEMMGLPFLGPDLESSSICFNKITTKLWLEKANIPVTPWMIYNDFSKLIEVENFFINNNSDIYIKAARQGSSIGCYRVTNKTDIEKTINQAKNFSQHILIEKTVNARELEVSAYQYKNKLYISTPGEIVIDNFYSFEKKYSNKSSIKTNTKADLTKDIANIIIKYAKASFDLLKLKDLSRIDFFIDKDTQKIYLNEINTMPGHTSKSLFPAMLEAQNICNYKEFLASTILLNHRGIQNG